MASMMNERGVTKQMCNRLLEPFMWHTCLVTSTEWENFFALRANDAADIHIQKIAYMMLEAYNTSTPIQLNEGEWHIPFREKMPAFDYGDRLNEATGSYGFTLGDAIKISVAMCARTSYTVIGEEVKEPDFKADIKLHDRLSGSGHWSPFEHIAKPMNNEEYMSNSRGIGDINEMTDVLWLLFDKGRSVVENNLPGLTVKSYVEHGWSGNIRGFIQYRKTFSNENRHDDRVLKNKTKISL
jgi:hypothetical protein